MKLASFVKTWRDFAPQTKNLLRGLFALGVVAFGVGLTLDFLRSPLLKEFSYWPSIFVTITGFLVGVPVALVGLSTITGEREEKAADDRVDALSKLAWDNFSVSVTEFCNNARYRALTSDLHVMREAQISAYEAISNYIHLLRAKELDRKFTDTLRFERHTKESLKFEEFKRYGTELKRPKRAADELYAEMSAAHGPFVAAVRAVSNALGSDQSLEIEWSIVRGNWDTLRDYVRIQRLERGMGWFNPRVDAALRNYMSRQGNPIADLSRTLETTIKRDDPASSGTAVDTLNFYMSMTRDELDRVILINPNFFGHRMVDSEQFAAAEKALTFVSDLLRLVGAVNDAKWPQPKTEAIAEARLRDAARYKELLCRRYSIKQVMILYPD